MTKVFISSVQKEFADERRQLCDYIREDSLLRKFFTPFLFEELPAIDLSAQEAYLSEAAQSEIYLGLYGEKYGFEDAEGVSPTEREFDTATEYKRHRLIFVKRGGVRQPKEDAFIKKVEAQLVRKSFESIAELKTLVYDSLVRYLADNDFLRTGPWDAMVNKDATLEDIDFKKVENFISIAREKRKLKLTYADDKVLSILHHLKLATKEGGIKNAALLLFGKDPQEFFPASEVKCMLFPSTIKAKPILSLQMYQGDLFEMIDSAAGFVMQHIDAYVGTHTKPSADVIYEIPYEAVHEIIVNACAHRTYESNGSVEVMVFKDRVEVRNPGQLPVTLTPEALKEEHNSLPTNTTLAKAVYLAGYIEKVGTGTTDVIELCENAGLQTPVYQQNPGDFKAILWRKQYNSNGPQQNSAEDRFDNIEGQNGPLDGPHNGPQDKKLARYRKELETLMSNPRITKEELADMLGIGRSTIKRDMQELRQSYSIEWVGEGRKGQWVIEKLK